MKKINDIKSEVVNDELYENLVNKLSSDEKQIVDAAIDEFAKSFTQPLIDALMSAFSSPEILKEIKNQLETSQSK